MKNLLISEFYRLRKNKGVIVTAIVALALAILLPLLMLLGVKTLEKIYGISSLGIYGLEQYYSLLGSSNIVGILLTINIASFACNDFAFGTVRNKIISGHTRTQVYLAKLIVNLVSSLAIYLVYSIICSGLIGIFFGVNHENIITAIDFKNIVVSTISFVFIHISSYSLLTNISMKSQTTKKSVIWYIVFVYAYAFSLELLIIFFDEIGFTAILDLLTDINPLNQLSYITYGELHTDLFILTIVSNIIYSTIITLHGIKSFNKKELK